jgi:hypothetical protein
VTGALDIGRALGAMADRVVGRGASESGDADRIGDPGRRPPRPKSAANPVHQERRCLLLLTEYLDAQFTCPVVVGTVLERVGTVRIEATGADESETLDAILGSLGLTRLIRRRPLRDERRERVGGLHRMQVLRRPGG